MKIKVMTLLEKTSALLKWMVSSSRSSYAFAICLTAILLAYRIQLTIGLFSSSVRPFDFNPGSHPLGFMLTYLPYDLALILGCFLMAWLFSFVPPFFKRTKMSLVAERGWLDLLEPDPSRIAHHPRSPYPPAL